MIWANLYTRIRSWRFGVSRTRRIVDQIADKLSHEDHLECSVWLDYEKYFSPETYIHYDLGLGKIDHHYLVATKTARH